MNQKVGRVRIVERAGPKLKNLLCNKAPWKKTWCEREECQPCKSSPGSCRAVNVVYSITCQTCKANGKKAIYFGESSRSWWDRSRDHNQALTTKNKDYAIVKHWLSQHGDQDDPPSYEYKVESTHKSAIHRQIPEAIKIDLEPEENLMNGKAEWGHNKVPRLKLPPEDLVAQQTPDLVTDQDAQPDRAKGKRRQCDNQESNHFNMQYTQRAKRTRMEKNAMQALRSHELASKCGSKPGFEGKQPRRNSQTIDSCFGFDKEMHRIDTQQGISDVIPHKK